MQREMNPGFPSCTVCRNLDYYLFRSGDEYGIYDGINPTRYLTLEFQDLRASAEKGCSTCDIINRGTRLFWGDYQEIPDASHNDGNKPYRLCLERRPSKSLTVFRFPYDPWIPGLQLRIEFFTENSI